MIRKLRARTPQALFNALHFAIMLTWIVVEGIARVLAVPFRLIVVPLARLTLAAVWALGIVIVGVFTVPRSQRRNLR